MYHPSPNRFVVYGGVMAMGRGKGAKSGREAGGVVTV